MATPPARLASLDRLLACAICERTILLGEEALRFNGSGRSQTVCRLCAGEARLAGWVEEGRPAPPPVDTANASGLLGRLRRRETRPIEPVLVPNADAELARATTMLIGVETFNASPYRGTISGISKSLGQPRVSVVAFGGRRPGVAITIAWDLSWYRYLVEPGGVPEVRLDERGDAIAELAPRWREWNARALRDGAIELEIAPR